MILGRHNVIGAPGLRVVTPRTAAAASANWWEVSGVTCVVAYRAKGAANYAASKSNLANPGTYDATDGAAYPTWDAGTGWTFDGASTQRLRILSLPYQSLAWTLVLRLTGAANKGYPFSAIGAADAAVIALVLSSGSYLDARVGNSGWRNVQSTPVDGVIAVAGVTPYWNGSAVTAISGAAEQTSGRGYIGANNNSYNAFTGTMQALAIYSSVLSEAQVGTLTTAMAAL